MANSQVKFKYGTQAKYDTIATYDNDTLYFTTDTHHLYKGDTLYNATGVMFISSLPSTGDINTLYINTSNGLYYRWNGSDFQAVSKGYTTVINDNANDSYVPTAKATKTYIDNAINDFEVNIDTTTIIDDSADDIKLPTSKATKTYVDSSISDKATITYVNNQLSNKADTTYVDNGLATKSENVIIKTVVGSIPNPLVLDNNTDYRYTTSNTSSAITVVITDDLTTAYISALSMTINITDYTELQDFIITGADSKSLIFLNGDIDISEGNHLDLLFFSDGSRICVIGTTYNI